MATWMFLGRKASVAGADVVSLSSLRSAARQRRGLNDGTFESLVAQHDIRGNEQLALRRNAFLTAPRESLTCRTFAVRQLGGHYDGRFIDAEIYRRLQKKVDIDNADVQGDGFWRAVNKADRSVTLSILGRVVLATIAVTAATNGYNEVMNVPHSMHWLINSFEVVPLLLAAPALLRSTLRQRQSMLQAELNDYINKNWGPA